MGGASRAWDKPGTAIVPTGTGGQAEVRLWVRAAPGFPSQNPVDSDLYKSQPSWGGPAAASEPFGVKVLLIKPSRESILPRSKHFFSWVHPEPTHPSPSGKVPSRTLLLSVLSREEEEASLKITAIPTHFQSRQQTSCFLLIKARMPIPGARQVH